MGHRDSVVEAAKDRSWQVRGVVADALARWPDRQGALLAGQLLDDSSIEVQRRVLAALTHWPLPQAGFVLLEAMDKNVYLTRKEAAEQLSALGPGRHPGDRRPGRAPRRGPRAIPRSLPP